jgi:hypothetical protein
MNVNDITGLFYCIDEFCKVYEEWEHSKLIPSIGSRNRAGKLSLSEMLSIEIMFHTSGFRDFKSFYKYGICIKYKNYFKNLPTYERFVQIKHKLFLPLTILLQNLRGNETGYYIIDSTSLKVCHNRRISRHKVFKGMVERGKSTMGWFYGFKLHIVINHKGELMGIKVTAGNKDDRSVMEELTKQLKGKLFGDKGYISKTKFKALWDKGLQLITGIKRTMKNHLMPLVDKIMLRGRFIVESVFNILKNNMNIEHTRHRSPMNFCINLLACLASYSFRKSKPSWKSISPISYP